MVESLVLTKRRHREILEYIVLLRQHLMLNDWNLGLDRDFLSDNALLAAITCTYGQRHARIQIASDFDDHPLAQQRMALVHELLHCHMNRLRVSMVNTFNLLGREAYEMGKSQLGDEVEYATDSIAQALAPKCPLPAWRG